MPHQQYDPSVATNSTTLLPTGASNTYKSKHFTIRYAEEEEKSSSSDNDASLKKLAVEIVLHGPALLELLQKSKESRDRDPFLSA